MSLNLNKFAVEVHENSKAHGWWDKERPFGEIAALIHSEWSEALEEYRAGRPLVWHLCEIDGETVCDATGVESSGKTASCPLDRRTCVHNNPKPEGIAVELIDGVIRILDYVGAIGGKMDDEESIDDMFTKMSPECIADCECENFPMFIATLHLITSEAFTKQTPEEAATVLLTAEAMVYYWVLNHGEDPEKVMLEKHEYNKTRSYKHGNKAC